MVLVLIQTPEGWKVFQSNDDNVTSLKFKSIGYHDEFLLEKRRYNCYAVSIQILANPNVDGMIGESRKTKKKDKRDDSIYDGLIQNNLIEL